MPRAHTQVEQVIKDYIRGTYEGDSEILKAVFHPEAQMTGFLKGQKIYGTAQLFIDDIGSNPSIKSTGADYQAVVTHLTVSGDVASATLEEWGLMGMKFTNYFHLLRDESGWRIVSKTFQSAE